MMLRESIKAFTVFCVCAMLAGCERGEALSPAEQDKAVSALPEHFDRARVEQDEAEEDRLRARTPTKLINREVSP